MSVLCGSFSACAKNAFSSSFFAHFCTQNTNSVCLSARFLHKSEEMGFLLLMAFLLKNLHFLGRKSAFSTFCPQFCGKPNAKKTRVKSVKIFTNHTFYRYVWRGQNHYLAREKVRPREGKIPTTWHRKNLEFANFDIFIPGMNSIFSCPCSRSIANFSMSPRAFAAIGINWKMEYENTRKSSKTGLFHPFCNGFSTYLAPKYVLYIIFNSKRMDFFSFFVYLRNFSK